MIRPAPIYPPAIIAYSGDNPNRKKHLSVEEKDTKRRDICGQVNDFSLCVAVLMLSFANTVKAIIRKVPVPGP